VSQRPRHHPIRPDRKAARAQTDTDLFTLPDDARAVRQQNPLRAGHDTAAEAITRRDPLAGSSAVSSLPTLRGP
jgi:hypothetical protein